MNHPVFRISTRLSYVGIINRILQSLFEKLIILDSIPLKHYLDVVLNFVWPSLFPDPSQISELLSRTISDAHTRTCLYSLEHIHEMFRKPQDLSRLLFYKNMAHEELWLECAQKLTTIIQQIIEFAKMVPGFMRLSQDDQIVLLKAGKAEIVIQGPATHLLIFFSIWTGWFRLLNSVIWHLTSK